MHSFHLPKFQINPISERDGWRLCDFIASNTDHLRRYFPNTVASNLTPDLSNLFVQQKVSEFANGKEFLFTLKEHEQRTIIGLVYVKDIDRIKKEAEIAYCIGYPFKNNGFATIAVEAISNWAITRQNLLSLKIIVHKSNTGSIKVATNCGYLWERILVKEHTPPNEEPLDMELYLFKHER